MNALFRPIHWLFAALFLAAAILVVTGARDYASSFNDGSRLASIEAIVDYHTFAIDQSIFAAPGSSHPPPGHHPYIIIKTHPDYHLYIVLHSPQEGGADVILPDSYDNELHERGTLDKIYVRGHFYSDKPLLPSVLLGGFYELAQQLFGLRAHDQPEAFTYLMTLLGCGLPYLIAIAATARTSRLLGLSPWLSLALTASFAFCTVGPAYTCQLNGHMMQLGVASLVFMLLADLARASAASLPVGKFLLLGVLCGFGYAVEQPTGGLLLAGTGLVLLYRRPHIATALLFGLAALPFLIAHHAISYSIGGTLRPIGQVPEFFAYQGSAFKAEDLTGNWNHKNFGWFLLYAGGLIYSDRGFLPSNIPLFLLVPGSVILVRRLRTDRPEMWLAGLWALVVWLVFATLSTNYSGSCCSVRWFVPLLAAGYYLLALLLRERPNLVPDFLLLSACGLILAAEMWWEGTWAYLFLTFWPMQGLALFSWAVYRLWRWRWPRLRTNRVATA
jgi:hypothetical protein